jgi:thiosulfate reductase cytochrome b subunit
MNLLHYCVNGPSNPNFCKVLFNFSASERVTRSLYQAAMEGYSTGKNGRDYTRKYFKVRALIYVKVLYLKLEFLSPLLLSW